MYLMYTSELMAVIVLTFLKVALDMWLNKDQNNTGLKDFTQLCTYFVFHYGKIVTLFI